MKKAIIIGAGPAGLTAAYELLKKTNIKPIVYEATDKIGGISQTVNYKGNRMDIGGHRFFSKSDKIMDFWKEILPLENEENNPEKEDKVFLIRNRISRILFLKSFFDYPITLSKKTICNLGFVRLFKIGLSYLKVRVFPVKDEKSLEDFYINRFGKELYETFFKDYTHKVWGVPCSELPSDWGAQRVKGLSVTKALLQAIKPKKKETSLDQKDMETSLISMFMYPKFGPGQLWEELASLIEKGGGEIHLNSNVIASKIEDDKIVELKIENNGKEEEITLFDYVFSTMPVRDLIGSMEGKVPKDARDAAKGLVYRDFMTVGLLLKDVLIKEKDGQPLKDNWIYIQEKDVMVGRLQMFNNWSPYMVKDKKNIFIGMEYFVDEGDESWTMKDESFIEMATKEMIHMGFINKEDVIDSVVVRIPKAYPAYLGTYKDFDTIIDFTNKIDNLFLVGRNGMHRYNNSDHSSLSSMRAVDNIVNDIKDKSNIWNVNVEKEYHEDK